MEYDDGDDVVRNTVQYCAAVHIPSIIAILLELAAASKTLAPLYKVHDDVYGGNLATSTHAARFNDAE